MFSYLCVRMPVSVSCSDFGERDMVAVKAVGQFFFWVGGWTGWKKERGLLEQSGCQCQGECLIIRHRKGWLSLTFPLCALSIPHSWGLKVSWMHFAAEIKRLFWCLTVILIEGRGSRWHERTGWSLWVCMQTRVRVWAFACLLAWLFNFLCATVYVCSCKC